MARVFWEVTKLDDSVLTYAAKVASTAQMPAVGARIFISSTGDAESWAEAALPDYSVGNADYADELHLVHSRIINDRERGNYRLETDLRGRCRISLLNWLTKNFDLLEPADIVIGDDVSKLERTSFWYALPAKKTKMKRRISGLMDKVGLTGTYFPSTVFYF
jgi:hypothetical protein